MAVLQYKKYHDQRGCSNPVRALGCRHRFVHDRYHYRHHLSLASLCAQVVAQLLPCDQGAVVWSVHEWGCRKHGCLRLHLHLRLCLHLQHC